MLEDLATELQYLATLDKIGVANLHESVEHLTEKYGNHEYFKQVFYALLSIKLNGE